MAIGRIFLTKICTRNSCWKFIHICLFINTINYRIYMNEGKLYNVKHEKQTQLFLHNWKNILNICRNFKVDMSFEEIRRINYCLFFTYIYYISTCEWVFINAFIKWTHLYFLINMLLYFPIKFWYQISFVIRKNI